MDFGAENFPVTKQIEELCVVRIQTESAVCLAIPSCGSIPHDCGFRLGSRSVVTSPRHGGSFNGVFQFSPAVPLSTLRLCIRTQPEAYLMQSVKKPLRKAVRG